MSSLVYKSSPVNSDLIQATAALTVVCGSIACQAAEAAVLFHRLSRRPRILARGLSEDEAATRAAKIPGAMAIEFKDGWRVVGNAYR